MLIKFAFALLTVFPISSAAPAESTELSVVAGDTSRSVRITGPKNLTDLGKGKYSNGWAAAIPYNGATARDRQRVPSELTADKGCLTHIRTRALIELSRELFIPRLMIAILMTGLVKPGSS